MVLLGVCVFGLLVPACLLIDEAWVRYLHPLAWVAVGMLGIAFAECLRFLSSRSRLDPAMGAVADAPAQSHL
jgi:hypothetical protein